MVGKTQCATSVPDQRDVTNPPHILDSDSDIDEFEGFTLDEIKKSADKANYVKERNEQWIGMLMSGEMTVEEVDDLIDPCKNSSHSIWLLY